ncbi:MAG: crotonase/enoyl-CoA hydratase family protein [Myxococcales bacterium]|nr:crotonase/enoyl-CoA hydratase family protein [Myxococcales bacterium]
MRVERAGVVWTFILDRPAQRNAVDRDTSNALYAAFIEFNRNDTACVAVLWGEGPDFCAGADLKAIARGEPNDVLPIQPGNPAPLGPTRLTLDKPVIAAIEGHAVAGGLELAIWADLRVAADDAIFGVTCRRYGVPLIDGGTVRLPRLIGLSRAMDLILTGRTVTAKEALDIGLVNRLVPAGTALTAATALAHQLAALPQACMRGDRRSTLASGGLDLAAGLEVEYREGLESLTAYAVEGARRFGQGER